MTLGVSPLTGAVFSGRLNKAGNLWVGKRTDVTSDFLKCVLEKAHFHGGTFEIRGVESDTVYAVTVNQGEQ